MLRLVSLGTMLVAVLVFNSAARADISVCNEFTARIHVAFAYPVEERFTGQGWWNVDPNQCAVIDFSFQGGRLYYTADSDEYKSGGTSRSRDHWGNKTPLFLTRKDFKSNDLNKQHPGTKREMFSYVELTAQQQANPVTITFHFVSGSTTINVKMK